MKITSISVQARDKNRVNVSIDGKYRFSLDIAQVADLGIRVGQEYDESQLVQLEEESQYGKLYNRALEYCFSRPHSRQEVRQYLYRKTRPTRTKTGELKPGVSVALTDRVFQRLEDRGYVNDEAFARYWVENRQLRKGISARKLQAELRAKGVDAAIISSMLEATERSDDDELQKIIAKKARRYDDPQKLIAYLARQGFSYDDIKQAVGEAELG
jgi:regulatory protein